jgi:aconitate hydratase 2/2-methylisocitrate dehydratase
MHACTLVQLSSLAVCAKLGRLPTTSEYLQVVGDTISAHHATIYQYLNFNLMPEYKNNAMISAGKKVIAINAGAAV